MNIKRKIEIARVKLYSLKLRFFGIMIFRFKMVLQKLPNNTDGYVTFEKNSFKDLGSIFINENLLNDDEYVPNNLVWLLVHEIHHVLLNHALRGTDKNNYVWNIATDHVIERDMKKNLGDVIYPYKKIYGIVEELDKELPHCDAEEAYNWLMKKVENNEYNVFMNCPACGGIDNKSCTEHKVVIVLQDKNGKTIIEISPDVVESMQQIKEMGSDFANAVKATIETVKHEISAIINSMKNIGVMGGNIFEYVTKLFSVEVPWDRILEKAIKNFSKSNESERSWRKLNKYYRPHNIFLPGVVQDDFEQPNRLIVGVDSSGSIGQKELGMFCDVIEKTFNFFQEIVLFVHDVDVQQEKTFNVVYEFSNFIKNVGFSGRGGTSHKHVFEKIQNIYEDEPESISMVIMLTDGHSDIEQTLPNAKWYNEGIPIAFLLSPDGRREIKLDEEKKNFISISMKEK